MCVLIPSVRSHEVSCFLRLGLVLVVLLLHMRQELESLPDEIAGINEISTNTEAKGLVFIIPAATWSSLLKLGEGREMSRRNFPSTWMCSYPVWKNARVLLQNASNKVHPSEETKAFLFDCKSRAQQHVWSHQDFQLACTRSRRFLDSTVLAELGSAAGVCRVFGCGCLRRTGHAALQAEGVWGFFNVNNITHNRGFPMCSNQKRVSVAGAEDLYPIHTLRSDSR